MATTLTVPPQVTAHVREGAQLQLAQAAYEVACAAHALQKDAPPLEDRRKMEQLWALLDAIGWAGVLPGPIEIDLREHSLALLIAVREIEPHMQDSLSEMPDDDQRKPRRTDELGAMQEFESIARRAIERVGRRTPAGALAVPPMLVDRVREGAYGLLALASEAIVRCALTHTEPEPMSRTQLERAWGLLGRLGWSAEKDTGEVIELGIAEHGVALHAAVETMIPLLAEWLDELDPADASRPDRADELRLLRLLRQLAARARRAVTSE